MPPAKRSVLARIANFGKTKVQTFVESSREEDLERYALDALMPCTRFHLKPCGGKYIICQSDKD